MKKHIRYYIVTKESSTDFRKVESDLSFSEAEGRAQIRKSTPDARTIKHISKTKAAALNLNK